MSKIFLKTLRLEEFPPKPVFYLFPNKPISFKKGGRKLALDDYIITFCHYITHIPSHTPVKIILEEPRIFEPYKCEAGFL